MYVESEGTRERNKPEKAQPLGPTSVHVERIIKETVVAPKHERTEKKQPRKRIREREKGRGPWESGHRRGETPLMVPGEQVTTAEGGGVGAKGPGRGEKRTEERTCVVGAQARRRGGHEYEHCVSGFI